MKNRRLLKLLAVALCFATLFTFAACAKGDAGDKKSAIGQIYNLKYEPEVEVLTQHKILGEIGSFADSTPMIAKFTKLTDGFATTNIYSHVTESVIKTFTDTATLVHGVFLSDNLDNVFLVVTIARNEDGSFDALFDPVKDISITLYDAKGTEVKKIAADDDYDVTDLDKLFETIATSTIQYIDDGIFSVDKTVYQENEDGTVTAIKEFKFTDIPNVDEKVGDYYFAESGDRTLVYDAEFNLLFVYTLPGEIEEGEVFILSNGNLFVQYVLELPDTADVYDIWMEGKKYDLVTELVSAKDGSVTSLDAKFIVEDVATSDEFLDEDYASKKLENIAVIYFIGANKMFDSNQPEFVLLSNSGDIGKELSKDTWAGMPQFLTPELFSVRLIDGQVEYCNAKGETVITLSSKCRMIAGYSYFTDGDAIYDLTGTEVYNLKANNAYVEYNHNDSKTAIIAKQDKETYATTYLRFKDGQTTQLAVVGGESKTAASVSFRGEYYVIVDATTAKAAYYNYEGALIAEFAAELSYIGSCDNGVLLVDNDNVYHKFTYAPPAEKK